VTKSHAESLEEVHSSVETRHSKLWKRVFAGPAYPVSVPLIISVLLIASMAGNSLLLICIILLPLIRGEKSWMEEKPAGTLVMGSHGHRLLGDLLLGQTVDPVRHQVDIPLLVVR
jgi:hypothetical protein